MGNRSTKKVADSITAITDSLRVTCADGRTVVMPLEEAAAKDEPEGTITVTVSATFLQWLIDGIDVWKSE